MRKAKTPKLLTSILAVFALIFGGLVVSVAPANAAASINGCVNSSWQPNNCGGSGGVAVLTALTDISGSTGTPITTTNYSYSCTPSSYKLFAATDTSYATALTRVVGIAFSTTNGQFSGTPNATITTTAYRIVATCSSGDLTRYSLNIAVVTGTAVPAIAPDSQLISGTKNTAITASTAFTATGFTSNAGVTYAITRGTLPTGLSFETTTGVVRGTPSVVSTDNLEITGRYNAETATAEITFDIADVVVSGGGGGGGGASVPEPSRKVTICHRTHSETNPYVRITVDYNSVNKKSGHQGHDEIFAGEHVFKAGIYKRAKDKDWGDIIPADPSGLNRWKPLNWTALGADIYNGKVDGCPSFDPVKYYNALRESGVPEKKIKQEIGEIEAEQAEAEPTTKKTVVTEMKYTGANKNVAESDNDKVTICHRTNSVTNPYVRITVSASSVYKNAGHYGHDEIYDGHHVFDSSVNYPNNKKDWGDIIPADPTGKNRWAALNMTALGKQIYDGTVEGCAEKSLQTLYNELREEGKTKKEILAELEKTKDTDSDPKDIDELTYTGSDPKTEKSEPKEPVAPAGVELPEQSLSGIVWLDINKDGLKDADEPFIKNIKISITNTATGESLDISEVTDENGFYQVEKIPVGDWKITTAIPSDLMVTYDSFQNPEGEIFETVVPSSQGFTWVGLVGVTEKVTIARLGNILKENPNALPLAQVPPTLQAFVKSVRAAKASGAKILSSPVAAASNSNGLAYTGGNDLAILFFGVLLMLSGLLLRLARTKR